VAYRSDDHTAIRGALGLLALLAATHYGWLIVPPEHVADAWNIAGAVARSAFVVVILWGRTGPILPVGALWLAEEAMVAGCSALFIVRPWHVQPGEAQCSALLSFDLGKVGALALVLLVVYLQTLIGAKRDDE
jgi:hypothetical protein